MLPIQIESAGIYNAKIARPTEQVSRNRSAALFELELPLADGGISYIDEQAQPIRKNRLICAKPNQVRHTKFPFACYYIHLRAPDETVFSLLSAMPDFIDLSNRSRVEAVFKEISAAFNSFDQRAELWIQSQVLQLIHFLRLETETGAAARHVSQAYGSVAKAIDYIRENLAGDLCLHTVAAAVSMSPTHFHTCFKFAIGKTLRDYVEEERIRKSVTLMLTTDQTLTRIAYACGFSSQSYYSYIFKRRMGTTPRAYIQQLNSLYEQ